MTATATAPAPARSSLPTENLQAMLDATASAAGTARVGMAQYFTPPWFARAMADLCPGHATSLLDLQSGRDALLDNFPGYGTERFGVEIDERIVPAAPDSGQVGGSVRPVHHVTGNCVRFAELMAELYPNLAFSHLALNPPFSLRFKVDHGPAEDSTLWTYRAALRLAGEAGTGYLLANAPTLERLGIADAPAVWLYQRFPAGIFPDAPTLEVGVVHFQAGHTAGPVRRVTHEGPATERALTRFINLLATDLPRRPLRPGYSGSPAALLVEAATTIAKILAEERRPAKPFNIWLQPGGRLGTYLSTHEQLAKKLTPKEVERLASLRGVHPVALTPEKETRDLLARLVDSGVYTVEPAAAAAIRAALAEAATAAVPIMPVTDFQRVAYCDEEEALCAVADTPPVKVTVGYTDDDRAFAYHQAEAGINRFLSQINHAGEWFGYHFDLTTEPAAPIGEPVALGTDPRVALDWVREHTASLTPQLTAGRDYPLVTSTYEFKQGFRRQKLHHEGGTGTYVQEHTLTLAGQDRYVEIRDDDGRRFRFMDRPSARATAHVELPDSLLWQLFTRPEVPTVAEVYPEAYARNLATLESIEMLADFRYYDGQRPYLARVATRDFALVGAETGCGKSLMCISLIAMKAPRRALIVAPQGTTRAAEDEDGGGTGDDTREMTASQWIAELRRFSPGTPVFELFSYADYTALLAANCGVLPRGIYVSYYEAMFSNDSREHSPKGKLLTNARLFKECGMRLPADAIPEATTHASGIGEERHGIRCIARPTLATLVGHHFDFVGLDEAHKAQKLSSQLTQNIIRLQPRYRYAFTATPIPNIVSDVFPICGWLAVERWHEGARRSTAWPYAREDGHRFCTTFLATERDLTQEAMNRAADPIWRGKCDKISPIISSPARLLKLLTPIMAYISKLDCNPALPPRLVHDVRVPMGARQAAAYAHYMDRANVPGKNAIERAGKQVSILRSLAAEPASSPWNCLPGRRITSHFNPKLTAILGLVAKIVGAGRQCVIVCSRIGQTAALLRRLEEAGIRCARIDSELPPAEHTRQANLFKTGRVSVLLMGIKCAQAHSFPQCQDLIIGSLEYTYGSFEQAVGRVYRVTTPRAVNIWCVLHQNTIEEIMFDAVATKGDAAAICLRGQRTPRDYRPADIGDILAQNFLALEESGATTGLADESETEKQWPALRAALQVARDSACVAC